MKAAVVESYDRPPKYAEHEMPELRTGEVMVRVRAAALTPLVRAQASGRHYAKTPPPFVPGADGVGTLENGQRVYFAFPRPPVGAMAEHVAVADANVVALPDDLDDVTAAALANPAMSSWVALLERASFTRGESVLILGATGASGRLAIAIARHLGAGRIIASSRNIGSEADVRARGADSFIHLSDSRDALVEQFHHELAKGVDVVLDYVWGGAATAFFAAATGHGSGASAPRIRFVNIGALGGAVVELPATVLRSSGLELLGSGLGSVSHATLVANIGQALAVARQARLELETRAVPLTDVEDEWSQQRDERVVFTT